MMHCYQLIALKLWLETLCYSLYDAGVPEKEKQSWINQILFNPDIFQTKITRLLGKKLEVLCRYVCKCVINQKYDSECQGLSKYKMFSD